VCSAPPGATLASQEYIAILINQGGGVFKEVTDLHSQDACDTLIAADFGGKGVANLLSAGSSTAIWLGNGDGTFTLQTGRPFRSYHPVVADFNGDGLPDIAAVIETNGSHEIGLWLNQGGGKFGPRLLWARYGPTCFSGTLARSDGKKELFEDCEVVVPRDLCKHRLHDCFLTRSLSERAQVLEIARRESLHVRKGPLKIQREAIDYFGSPAFPFLPAAVCR
jgi:hypothetical protein